MTPSFLDGSHAYTPLRARLRSVATKAGVELEKSTVVLKICQKLSFLDVTRPFSRSMCRDAGAVTMPKR